MLSYAYLWHREARGGQEEGLKDRPTVVVVARTLTDGQLQLLVAPITHSPPRNVADAVEIPKKIKKHLGLDQERSWIITSELNRFIWPGPDIRLVKSAGGMTPYYGAIPEKLFEEIREHFLAKAKLGRMDIVKRTE